MIIVDTIQPAKLQVDCVSELNVISKRDIRNTGPEESSMTLYTWNNVTTKTIGTTRLIVRNSENKNKYNIECQVVKQEITPLIDRNAAEDNKLITDNYDNFQQLHNGPEQDILTNFNDGISVDYNTFVTAASTLHFTTYSTAEPKVMSPQLIPLG